MDKWIQRFRSAKTVAGQERVIIPGEPEIEMQNDRMKNGIYLMQPVVDNLKILGDSFKVEL